MQILGRRRKISNWFFLNPPLPSHEASEIMKSIFHLDSPKSPYLIMIQSLQLYNLKLIILLLFSLSFRSPKCWSAILYWHVQVSHSFMCILHLMMQSVKLNKLKFILLLLFSLSFRSPNLQYCTCALMCRYTNTWRVSRLCNGEFFFVRVALISKVVIS